MSLTYASLCYSIIIWIYIIWFVSAINKMNKAKNKTVKILFFYVYALVFKYKQ